MINGDDGICDALPEGARHEIRHAWCQMCGPTKTYCSTLCHIVDGEWVAVEGNPKARNDCGRAGVSGRALCAKGNAAIQMLKDPHRLRYPLRRAKPKGEVPADILADVMTGEDAALASGVFERCTWDEALADIAERLKLLKQEHGAESFGILSPQAFRVLGTLGRRFLNVYGSPNYLHSGICALQRRASGYVTIGKATCAPAQLDKTKLLVNWGANPENSGILHNGIAARLDAQDAGMRVIDIRPMADSLTARADLWLPVRPGTDGALALAILHVIIGEELYDRGFVRDWCFGFDDLARHVEQFTPAWAAVRTGLPEEVIVRTARLMGTQHPMGIVYGNGIGDQQVDGHWTCVAICLIEAITGNLDIPGGGGAPSDAGASGSGASDFSPLVKPRKFDLLSERLPVSEEDERMGYAAGMSRLLAPEFPRWYQRPETWESGPNSAYFKALMTALTDDPVRLRAVVAQATNPLSATRQPKKVAAALRHLELYVVHDTHWNPSCAYADYVLPACTHYECSQQFAVKNFPEGTFVAINQKIAEPLGESCSDWDFYLRLAVAMGYGADFWEGDMDACLREQLEGSGVTLEELRAAPEGIFIERVVVNEQGMAVDRGLEADQGAAVGRGPAVDQELEAGREAVAGQPLDASDGQDAQNSRYRRYGELFAVLPYGKVQCRNVLLEGKPTADEMGVLGGFPEYAGPPEGVAETPDLLAEYPLVFSDVHAYRWCNHGYFVGVPYLREHQPYPWVKMHPETAAVHGVADGDWVRIESPHGWVRLMAQTTATVPPGVLMARRGWWQPCDELGLSGYACFDGGSECSVLYNSDQERFDAFHSAMAKQTLVRIRAMEEAEGEGACGGVGADADGGEGAGEFAGARGDVGAGSAGKGFFAGAAGASLSAVAIGGRASVAATDGESVSSTLSAAEKRGYVFDADRCIGCGACVVACKQHNGIPAGASARCSFREGEALVDSCASGRDSLSVPSFSVKVCLRCSPAHCIETCPTQALSYA